jgi:hypothetical protein
VRVGSRAGRSDGRGSDGAASDYFAQHPDTHKFFGDQTGELLPQHVEKLKSSAINPEVARARGYWSTTTKAAMSRAGFSANQQMAPSLMIPLWDTTGRTGGHQARPDFPRSTAKDRAVKYETPSRQRNLLDIPPGVLDLIGDPEVPIWITEGALKADSAVSAGLCAASLTGVWNWKGTNALGGKTVIPDFGDVALNGRRVIIAYDSDAHTKVEVHQAMAAFAAWLRTREANVEFLYLPTGPNGDKVGLDDWLFEHNGDATGLWELVSTELRPLPGDAVRVKKEPRPDCPPTTLPEVEETFRKWIVMEDPVPLRATLGTLAGHYLGGDAMGLQLVGGSGNTKTVIVQALSYAPGVVAKSRIASSAALLSGTPRDQVAVDATGGVLREIGDSGILALKDFTTILSLSRDVRNDVLAAFREILDGKWDRPVGGDGGRTLEWKGRCSLIAACTTAIDSAHGVLSIFGNRFLVVRTGTEDSHDLGERSLVNRGKEDRMREELAVAVAGLFTETAKRPNAFRGVRKLRADERRDIVAMASLMSAARSPVERDHQGEIVLVGDPDAPTRAAKALGQMRDGLLALGLGDETWDVLVAVALDSIPKLRRLLLLELLGAEEPMATKPLALAVGHPTRTTRRALEDLQAHKVIGRRSGGGSAGDVWSPTPGTLSDAKAFSDDDLATYRSRFPDTSIEDDDIGDDEDLRPG